MNRYLVIGPSGAGKTTLARALAVERGLPWVELDALYFGRDWTPRGAFEAEVGELARTPFWVMDGNHAGVRDLLWSRANVILWLDLPCG